MTISQWFQSWWRIRSCPAGHRAQMWRIERIYWEGVNESKRRKRGEYDGL